MVDPFTILLDDIEADPFALLLEKKRYEDSFFKTNIEEDDLSQYNIDMNGSGIFIGRHGYTGMGDFYSGTHGNTGMGFF